MGAWLAKAGAGIAKALDSAARDRRGNVATIFAVAAIPMLVGVGAGIDISRFVGARNNLQDALDNAGLALGRMPAGTSTTALQTAAQQWVNANIGDKDLGPTTVTVTKNLGVVQIDASSTVTTAMSGMIGMQSMTIQAHSTIKKYGLSHVELALVLDNTGSMADDNKLTNLQSAATTLVSTLSASAQATGDPNALKVGVVPFSISVNVGSGYQGSTWLTGIQPTAYGPDLFTTSGVDRFLMLKGMGQKWGGCIESRPMPYDVQDTAPDVTTPATLFVPFFAPDEPDDYITYGSYRVGYGNNYLADVAADSGFAAKQGDPLKYTNAGRIGQQDALSPYPIGPNSGCGTAPMLPLTTDMNAVNAELQKMVANGNTHIPIGLAWGWNLLSPNMPFGAKNYGLKNLLKIAVLVTDGANTYAMNSNNKVCQSGNNLYYCPYTPTDDNSNYTGYGYAWQKRISNNGGSYSDYVSAMNDRLATLCANMKAKGIVLYTVPVEVTDTGIKSLLQNCASSPDKYIDVSNSSGLQAAFNNIAGSIGNLRISH